MGAPELRIIGLGGLPDVKPGDDVAALICEAAERQGTPPAAGDVLIVFDNSVTPPTYQITVSWNEPGENLSYVITIPVLDF